MSLHGALATRLSAAVASISGRAYRVRLPQSVTYPALTYRVVSAEQLQAINGPMTTGTKRIEVTVWCDMDAGGHTQAKATAEEVRTALDGWSGTEDSTVVSSVTLQGDVDLWDDQLGAYGIPQDFFVMFNQ